MATLTKAQLAKAAASGKKADAAARAAAAKAETDVVLQRTVETLKTAWTKAAEDYATYSDAKAAAAAAADAAMVWQARVAYITSMHESIVTTAGIPNYSGAATTLGVPRNTLRPYIYAGQALAKAKRVYSMEPPTADDVKTVNDSFDKTARADRNASNARAKARAAASEKDAAKSGVPADGAETGAGDVSLTADVLATAKTLVAQVKALRELGEWNGSDTAKAVVATLAEVFPKIG